MVTKTTNIHKTKPDESEASFRQFSCHWERKWIWSILQLLGATRG